MCGNTYLLTFRYSVPPASTTCSVLLITNEKCSPLQPALTTSPQNSKFVSGFKLSTSKSRRN
ncbi:hypothetical protein AN958_05267 [Leucoagaricus sp. SymC.cos]|nr:hypothetical protein AN958_05267 [Leucoagaricus sp. SymC.cos]